MLLLDVPKIELIDTTTNVNDQNLRHQHLKCLVGKQILFDVLKKIHIHIAESLLGQDVSCATKQILLVGTRSSLAMENKYCLGNCKHQGPQRCPTGRERRHPLGGLVAIAALLGQSLALKTNIVCLIQLRSALITDV